MLVVPMLHPFTALQVALAYMHHIFKLHGLPQVIISNRIDLHFDCVPITPLLHYWHALEDVQLLWDGVRVRSTSRKRRGRESKRLRLIVVGLVCGLGLGNTACVPSRRVIRRTRLTEGTSN